MTTSPFGNPIPTAEPQPTAPASSSSEGRSKGLLVAVAGVAAVAATAAGVYFFAFAGDDGSDEAQIPRGTATSPQPTETTPALPEIEPETQLSSRNPFAALVVAGGGGAEATVPDGTSSSSGGTTSSGTGTSGSGSSGGSSAGGTSAGTAGADGKNGADGSNGKDGAPGRPGPAGAAGPAGASPTWVTITLRDVVDDATPNPTGTFTVRDAAGEVTTPSVAVDDQVAEVGDTAPQAVTVVSYEDLTGDGEMDYAVVSVGEAGPQYSVWIGEALPLFGY